ncbi:lytic murein transglycosylase [Enterovirga rhinocerotis]|uniref:Lytic murein transglycosylase n=1 Tax=Enterovirga rhinocerotis TaxID=1339210 RepID=A0A4R7BY04_9HYPH|nr:lytic murein transglycosylase [Enterovirga rhinocerotis]TDR90413.1 lytic murein transglycosylase [Enterovirga rhinocerotis]
MRFKGFVLAAVVGLAGTSPALANYQSCLAGLRSEAASKGISARTFDATAGQVQPDMTVLDLMGNQPEFKTPIWDYLTMLVDDERVQDGRAAMRRWGQALATAESRYGVDRHVIAGVWGVESNFGKDLGTRPLVQSLTTLSCYATRRRDYFKGELMATLRIIQSGDIHPSRLTGSWAGAFGQTQFMPSTYQRLAVDLDGDGRRDIVDSVPDAVGSTANFLRRAGWVNGLPWGFEVRVPSGVAPTGRKGKRPLSAWASAGVTRADGRPLSGNYTAGLIMPAGRNGPGFLVTRNFDALYSYNGAESYGLAISVLSDRLRGAPGIQGQWPTDDPGLTRVERRELMVLLARRGYDVGEPDGRIGPKTRDAIKDVERRLGMKPTGRAGGKVLNALRRG